MMGKRNPAATGLRKDSSNRNYNPSLYSRKLDAEEVARMCERPQRIGKDTWRVVCPVHGGHSLQITQKPDIVLLHCFGCGRDAYPDIINALGIKSHQLNYRQDLPQVRAERKAKRKQRISRDVFEHEILVCEIFLSDLFSGKKITAEDVKRSRLALSRVIRWGGAA